MKDSTVQKEKVIVIDLGGTLADGGCCSKNGSYMMFLRPGSVEFLEEISKLKEQHQEFNVILWTSDNNSITEMFFKKMQEKQIKNPFDHVINIENNIAKSNMYLNSREYQIYKNNNKPVTLLDYKQIYFIENNPKEFLKLQELYKTDDAPNKEVNFFLLPTMVEPTSIYQMGRCFGKKRSNFSKEQSLEILHTIEDYSKDPTLKMVYQELEKLFDKKSQYGLYLNDFRQRFNEYHNIMQRHLINLYDIEQSIIDNIER